MGGGNSEVLEVFLLSGGLCEWTGSPLGRALVGPLPWEPVEDRGPAGIWPGRRRSGALRAPGCSVAAVGAGVVFPYGPCRQEVRGGAGWRGLSGRGPRPPRGVEGSGWAWPGTARSFAAPGCLEARAAGIEPPHPGDSCGGWRGIPLRPAEEREEAALDRGAIGGLAGPRSPVSWWAWIGPGLGPRGCQGVRAAAVWPSCLGGEDRRRGGLIWRGPVGCPRGSGILAARGPP
ncbi:hypothetical protein NDU88_003262 [Pleurodeles waltl]|uniref:Uncharacterized protein n=1 Tax=Pleurodeles waltl TaxID=8319 RepID=A0AAV7MV37_PLEWA|nr:hypothetical protein NDU88_003262 [Pleurodeles waltl]